MFGRRKRTQILVVGAGPAGLMTALQLQRRGLEVTVVDQAWRAAGRSYAAVLHPSTLALLEELGLAREALEAAHRIDALAFYDGAGRRGEITLRGATPAFPFVAVLPQSTLESLLERELERQGIDVAWLHRVAGLKQEASRVVTEVEVLEVVPSGYAVATTSVEVSKTLAVESDYVVGADGHRSMVRRALEIEYESWGDVETFDVFEFESEEEPSGEVRVVLDARTANVLWTLPNGRQRWSFQVTEPRSREREREKSRLNMALPGEASPRYSAAALERRVSERAPWFTARVGDIAWAGEAGFEKRLAKRLGSGRVWLVGDAAHQTGPIGVQSMNMGLLEARRLADALGEAGAPGPASAKLEEYEQACVHAWCRLLGIEELLRAGEGADAWVRRNIERIVPCIPGSEDDLAQMVQQLGLTLVER